MREIRIRALDAGKKKFRGEYFIRCDGKPGNIACIKPDRGKFKYSEIDRDVIFLLNTGIKDKSGMEGFHKDIVRDFRGGFYTIEWDDHFATFIMKDNSGNYLPIYFLRYGEIVGNALVNSAVQ